MIAVWGWVVPSAKHRREIKSRAVWRETRDRAEYERLKAKYEG